jgi:hypothetical protein
MNGSEAAVAIAPATRVQIEDNRQLRLSLDDALEALLSLDRQTGGWLWRATEHAVSFETGETQALVVQARRSSGAEPETVRFERQHIGAAIIHYCHVLRVPLPRGARKEIELSAEGAVLLLSLTIDGPRTRLASPASA